MRVSARPFERAESFVSVMPAGAFELWNRTLTESRLRAKSASSAIRRVATRQSPTHTDGAASALPKSKASYSRMGSRQDDGRVTRKKILSPLCLRSRGLKRTSVVEPVVRARTDERRRSRLTFQTVEKTEIEEKDRGEPGRIVRKETGAKARGLCGTPAPAPGSSQPITIWSEPLLRAARTTAGGHSDGRV